MNLNLGCVTDTGKYRNKNQDRVICQSRQINNEILAVTCICDGIGSFRDSEIASEMVINGINIWFGGIVKFYPQVMSKEELIDDLEFTIRELNELVCEYAEEKQSNIGCTMSLMLMINFEYYIFHVGDSRIYCVRNRLIQLTHDEVTIKLVNGREKNLLANYIGKSKALAIYKQSGTAQTGDVFISGSDGLYKKFTYEDVKDVSMKLQSDEAVEKVCRNLIQLVLARGEKDNISCSIIRV